MYTGALDCIELSGDIVTGGLDVVKEVAVEIVNKDDDNVTLKGM